MDKTPLISVVIPCYNYGIFLPTALHSALMQTYPAKEILIIDDGSADSTKEVAKTFQEIHKNVHYIRHPSNLGLAAARNTGVKAARGEFIAFLDADDYWLPQKLELQLQEFRRLGNPSLGVVYSGYKYTPSCIERFPSDFKNHRHFLKQLLVRNVITGSASSVLIKREVFEKVGLFNEKLEAAEDWEMWLRIARFYEFQGVKYSLVILREHSQNMSRDVKKMVTNARKVVNRAVEIYRETFSRKDLLVLRSKALSYIHLSAAQTLRDIPSRRREFMHHLLLSVYFYPFRTFERDDKYLLFAKAIFPKFVINLAKRALEVCSLRPTSEADR